MTKTRLSNQGICHHDIRARTARPSLVDTGGAQTVLGHAYRHLIREGPAESTDWYVADLSNTY